MQDDNWGSDEQVKKLHKVSIKEVCVNTRLYKF